MEQLELLTRWAQSNVETTLFYLIAAFAIPSALGVLLDRAIIRSGFMLIGVFGSICGLFLLLQAQFLAMAQLMIYAVGITLLVVIALMLTNPRLEKEGTQEQGRQQSSGFLAAAFLLIAIYLSLRSESWPVNGTESPVADNIGTIGLALTTTYSLPFEFASVLLLTALIGAILLAKAGAVPKAAPTLEEEQNAKKVRDSPPLARAGSGSKSK